MYNIQHNITSKISETHYGLADIAGLADILFHKRSEPFWLEIRMIDEAIRIINNKISDKVYEEYKEKTSK